MADTRTGASVRQLVAHISEDLGDVVDHLQRGRELMRSLESDARGVNGLSPFLRGQGQALDKMMEDLREEADDVEKKMLAPRPEITSSVDADRAAAVKVAKEKNA